MSCVLFFSLFGPIMRNARGCNGPEGLRAAVCK